MDYDTFAAQWTGHRIDYDHVYRYQCVDLILEYLHDCFHISGGVSGNAIDYWTHPSTPLLNVFDKLQTSDVRKGDIVILNGLPGNPYGHIGIATGNENGTDVEILEQNGQNGDGDGGNPNQSPGVSLTDGNQIRTRYIQKVRIAGVLRHKLTVAAQPFTVTPLSPKMIELVRDTHLWDLTQPNYEAMNAHPVGLYPLHYQENVQATARHSNGSTYYLVTPQSTTGFNVADCQDYSAPALPAALTASPPAAPVSFPAAAIPFQVTKPIQGYSSASAAIAHTGTTSDVSPRVYYQFKTDITGAINITRTVGTAGVWINPNDLVEPAVPPAPTDWRGTLDTTKAGRYICINQSANGITIYDLEGKRPAKNLQFLDVLDVSGFFTYTDGQTYARPKNAAGNYFWYGIHPDNLELYETWYDETYDTHTTPQDHKATGTLKPRDYPYLAVATMEKYTMKVMDIFVRKKPK